MTSSGARIALTGFSFALSSFVLADAPPRKTPELLQIGKALFIKNCVICHGVTGDGQGDASIYMNPKPPNLSTGKFEKGEKPSEVFNTITKGLDGSAMSGFPGLPKKDRWALTYFVLSLRKAQPR